MNRTKQMNREMSIVAGATLAATALLTLTACGSGELSKTSGLFDEVKYRAGKAGSPAVTHIKPGTKSERYCVSYRKGVCSSYGSRQVPTTEVVTDKPAVPGKPALYCVELDDVKGDKGADDKWYTVRSDAYNKVSDLNEGAKVTDLEYLHEGCRR